MKNNAYALIFRTNCPEMRINMSIESNNQTTVSQKNSTAPVKSKAKQVAAIICLVLLAALYLMTLVFAIFKFPGSDKLLIACIAGTIILPVLAWAFIWLYGKMTHKKTIATVFPDAPSDEEVLEARIYQAEADAAAKNEK